MKKKDTPKKAETVIAGFKGFDKDFKCQAGTKNEKQYESGKEYEEGKVKICESGFHFCENPLDIFNYYPAAISRFAEVEGKGMIDKDANAIDTKIASSHLKIGLELSLHDIILRGIKFIFERTTLTKESITTKDKLQASNSGDSGAASNSGYSGAASNSGDRGAASNSGDSGAASNSGDSGAAFNIANYGTSETTAKESASVALGYNSSAKANIGSWIVLAERNDKLEILNMICAKVDGTTIKADTFYRLSNGKLINA